MYQAINVVHHNAVMTITLNRVSQGNSLNDAMVRELHAALQEAQHKSDNRIIILQGQSGVFCKGMDLVAVANQCDAMNPEDYMQLLHQFATIPRVIVACVDGVAMGGGVGLVAVSDLVIATANSQFSLPEILWNLLPCCVAPYLIRRIGFQAAYRLALTAQKINADEATRIQLVDILTTNLAEEIRQQMVKLSRLDLQAIQDLKNYFSKMWIVTQSMENAAVAEISRLLQLPQVKQNLKNFVTEGRFPWDASK